jgi:DNA-binding MarR family transcriptional regulator
MNRTGSQLSAKQAKMAVGEFIDMRGVEDQIGFVLRQAQLAVFKDLIEALSPFDLRPSDFSALRVIECNPDLKQQDVGIKLGIKRPNIVYIIDGLCKRRLITREKVPEDLRSYSLNISEYGREVLQQAEKAHLAHEARLRSALGHGDIGAFVTCLAKLTQLGPVGREPD